MYIAFDFDGTVCEHAFPDIGPENRRVIEYLQTKKAQGAKLILWTCREDRPERAYLTEAAEWCRKQGISIDYINENPEVDFGYPKIYADVYIDDRAVNPHSCALFALLRLQQKDRR